MVAFWGLTLLVMYGCFHGGGFITFLNGLLGESDTTLVDPFPLLGVLRISGTIAIGLVAVCAWLFHSLLNRPKVADTLIDTEGEMNKVTWPTWAETYAGSLAVAGMVLVLFVFLTGADLFLSWFMQRFVGGAS
jgi:preprotein translocase SecE subunit